MGYLPPALAAPGTLVTAEVRGRGIEAEVVKLPFYRRTRRTKL
jgi:aminomethyltransferase